MSKRIFVMALLGVGLALALQGADRRTTQGEWVYLQNGSNLRISIETYQSRQGWTPVIVSVAGAEISAVMDGEGRVVHHVVPAEGSTMMAGTGRVAHARAKGLEKPILPLFTIELKKGRILLGREAHAIRIYEQNGVRTRFVIAEGAIALPLRLGQGNKAGTLRFGGLEIPARVNTIMPMPITGNKIDPQAMFAGQPITRRGCGAEAQLTPSRIRARGK